MNEKEISKKHKERVEEKKKNNCIQENRTNLAQFCKDIGQKKEKVKERKETRKKKKENSWERRKGKQKKKKVEEKRKQKKG